MSSSIETLNKVIVEDFGFFANDGSRIRLGALPPISYEKFCDWSTDTILEFLEGADNSQKNKLRIAINSALARTIDLEVRKEDKYEESGDPELAYDRIRKGNDSPEAVSDLASTLIDSTGLRIHPYSENPFRLNGKVVTISNFYDLKPINFSYFAIHYISGGHRGWNPEYGIADFALRNLKRLAAYFEIE